MKLEGTLYDIPIYSSPDVPKDMVYLLNNDAFERVLPKRKDGKGGISKLRKDQVAGFLNALGFQVED